MSILSEYITHKKCSGAFKPLDIAEMKGLCPTTTTKRKLYIVVALQVLFIKKGYVTAVVLCD